MKNTIYYLFLSCILIAGCTESTLCGPPIISKVEFNSDSLLNHSSRPGTYKVYLKSDDGCDPVFYSYVQYNSGESLVPMSNLQSMVDVRMRVCMDSIRIKNMQIKVLEIKKETMEQQLYEKDLLIRFLTGK